MTAIRRLLLISLASLVASAAVAASPSVSFGNLTDGQKVTSPFKVEMRVEGLKVAPAGTYEPSTGHHHLIINGASIKKGEVVPKDDKHLHFGAGQTDTTLDLTPGTYTLTLQFADGAHLSMGEPLSKTITIEVVKKG